MIFVKKGQVTIFIILAFLIIGGVILFFSLRDKLEKNSFENISLEQRQVKEIVDSCLKKTLEEGILYLGLTGGYLNFSGEKINGFYSNVPAYSTLEGNLFPDEEILSHELVIYVNNLVDLCLDFSESNLNVSLEGEIISEISFSRDKIKLSSEIPVFLKTERATLKMKDFYLELNSQNLLKDFEVANLILNSINSNGICINCFSSELSENNLLLRNIPSENSNYLFELTDKNYFLQGEEYKLVFGRKYE